MIDSKGVGMMDDDASLREKVRQLLRKDKDLRSYGLNADVIEGEAQLQGIVDTLGEKERAGGLISKVPGVKSVANAVAISTDGAVRDEDVTIEVAEELDQDPRVDLRHIGAESVGGHGTVVLKGRAEDPAEMEAAREAAFKARGVTRVVSQVKVGGEEMSLENIFHSQVNNDREE
ncbi:BON domain-containing protein [Moorella naiadis]|uniref:BON domain-containing protein n=1 Tax=Moorella naiadis (nom. illeg.) TaxID=3093670 RepID=UPI003D9CB9A8